MAKQDGPVRKKQKARATKRLAAWRAKQQGAQEAQPAAK